MRQLLTFARKSEVQFEPVNVNNVVEELAKMLLETFPKTIAFSLGLENSLLPIVADHSQLHQALLNLCVNARDAMSKGGRLSITTGTIPGEIVRRRFATAAEESYLVISVSDTGVGMDEETKSRIFEPFFTTKGLDKGTGLGLAVVHGVAKSHNGFIDVNSKPGQGSTFRLFLPARRRRTDDEQLEHYQGDVAGGNETVLLIEDEEMLLDLIQNLLKTYGYRVLTARDGHEAVEVYRNHTTEIAAVVSDVGLPNLGGWDAFLRMKEINPRVKTIFASGYVDADTKTEMLQGGIYSFIQKPYLHHEILRTLREAIDTSPAR